MTVAVNGVALHKANITSIKLRNPNNFGVGTLAKPYLIP